MGNKYIFTKVYEIVKKIPKKKVMTYGQIAFLLNKKLKNLKTEKQKKITPQTVGWALHVNKDPKVPCHRVVDRNGRIAPNYAFNGWKEQKIRLTSEGVKFKDEMYVDLAKYLWNPK